MNVVGQQFDMYACTRINWGAKFLAHVQDVHSEMRVNAHMFIA